ncbi:hypothetical protein OH492_00855 [Vibrio chagasii]|nr:hypothetical protein [Vibrio chagasii]
MKKRGPAVFSVAFGLKATRLKATQGWARNVVLLLSKLTSRKNRQRREWLLFKTK